MTAKFGTYGSGIYQPDPGSPAHESALQRYSAIRRRLRTRRVDQYTKHPGVGQEMADLGDYDGDLRAYHGRMKKLRPNEVTWANLIENEALARREARRAFAEGRNVLLFLVGAYALLVLWIWWRAGNPLDNLRGALWFVLFIPMLWIAYSRTPETRTARRKTVGTWTLWSLACLGCLLTWAYLNGRDL